MERKAVDKKNNHTNQIILISVLTIGAVLGIIKLIQMQRYVSTDDAQLETDISPVSTRVSGYIDRVCFTDNQLMKKGDTLIVLDKRDLKIRVEQAQAALENALAMEESIRENAQSVREGGGTSVYKIDELRIRLANAKSEWERHKKMFSEHAVTQQQLDKVQTEKETLEKQLDAAKQQQKESNSKTGAATKQIKVAESTIAQHQSDLDYAQLQLSYAVVTSPINGIASKRNAVPGQLLQAGQSFCSVVSSQKKWVVANFKETQLAKIKPGMNVEIEIDAFSNETIKGTVESFSSATGAKFSLIPPDNATGNFVKVVQRIPVKIRIDSTCKVYNNLAPGMSVYIKVDTK